MPSFSKMQGAHKLKIVDDADFKELTTAANTNIGPKKLKNSLYKKNHTKASLKDFLHGQSKRKKRVLAGGVRKRTHQIYSHGIKKTIVHKWRNQKLSIMKKKIKKARACRAINKMQNDFPNLKVSDDKDCLDLPQDRVNDDKDVDNSIDDLIEAAKHLSIRTPANKLHSSRYRPYCDNTTNAELEGHAMALLKDLQRFQKRAHARNPVRAYGHRRCVVGFREVKNMLLTMKTKLIIIATDCEDCSLPGGINDIINDIKVQCSAKFLPLAFVLKRRQLARCLQINGQVSCLAVLDVNGAHSHFTNLLAALELAKHEYIAITNAAVQ